jgi:hypothetical protein
MGGRVMLESMAEKDGWRESGLGVAGAAEAATGEEESEEELKLSKGLASGGDIRLAKGGSRVVVVMVWR